MYKNITDCRHIQPKQAWRSKPTGENNEEVADDTDQKSDKIFSSFKYVNIISIFFGVMPVCAEAGLGKNKYHPLGYMFTFLYKVICVYFCIRPIVFISNFNEERDLMTDWIWKLDKFHYTFMLSNITTLTILLIHTNKISKLNEVIGEIHSVDIALISHDIISRQELKFLKYREVKYFILVIISCIVLILGSSMIMTHKYYADNPFKIVVIIQDFTHMCAFCVELQFHALVIMVKHRFCLVNNELIKILHYLPALSIVQPEMYRHEPYVRYKMYTVHSRLHTLTHIHNMLMIACMKSNKLFQFQILLDMFNTCVFLLVDIYAFMFQLLYTDMSWFDMFNIWPIHHTLKLILIAFSGQVVKENIYHTKDILAVASISTSEVGATIQYFIQNEIEAYLMVLNNNKFNQISLCRVIAVDLTMLLRIINGTCTYVLIMLQYRWNVF